MTFYELVLFVHVLGAILWLGGGVMFQILAERATRSNDAGRVTAMMHDADQMGSRYFMPLSITVLTAGLILVFNGDWGFDHWFILGGLAGLVASSVLGGALLGPRSKQLFADLRSSGTITPELRTRLDSLKNLSRLDISILTVVVFLMTTKPGS